MSLVEVIPYDPEWPRAFERIHAMVWPAVHGVALSIEHVGSTSVPGLAAKPIIDACIVVTSRSNVPACIDALTNLGYAHRGNLGVPDREAFRAPEVPRDSAAFPRHHFYLSPRGGLSLKNQLGLRDYLRSHPEAAHEYGELKGSLAGRRGHELARGRRPLSTHTSLASRIDGLAGCLPNARRWACAIRGSKSHSLITNPTWRCRPSARRRCSRPS